MQKARTNRFANKYCQSWLDHSQSNIAGLDLKALNVTIFNYTLYQSMKGSEVVFLPLMLV